MRRLLQRLDNGLYYRKGGTWTKDPNAAFNFDDSFDAVHCCVGEHLPSVYYVLKFEDPEYDIRLGCCTQAGDQVRTGRELPTREIINVKVMTQRAVKSRVVCRLF